MPYEPKLTPDNGIQVWARTAELAAIIKHPTGAGFRDIEEPVTWPYDQFTLRRLEDGDVLDHPPTRKEQRQAPEPAPAPGAAPAPTKEVLEGMSKADLIEQANRLNIETTSTMTKGDIVNLVLGAMR
jgi:hypothetical protein